MTVPRWAEALVRGLARPGRADDAIGDLNEMHHRRARRHGRFVAHLLTAFGAVDLSVALLRERVAERVGERSTAPGSGHEPELHWRIHRDRKRFDVRRILEDWSRDLGQAFRSLGRARGYTIVTIVTLALAIGANTAIFSVVDAVLLDPLEYPDAGRLVSIHASAPGTDLPAEFGPAPEFLVMYEEAETLESVAMWRDAQTTISSGENIDRLFATQATPALYPTLGVTPAIGRLPTLEDDPLSVALISHELWETWFGSDPDILDRSIQWAGRTIAIIGVMKPEFRFPYEQVTVWIHQKLQRDADRGVGDFGGEYLLARVQPDTDLEAVETELAVLARRIPARFGGSAQYRDIIDRHQPVVRTLEEEVIGDVDGPLWLLLGTVGIVLLIACANVANLFSVRAESRRRDFDVRQALGAGRGRLVRTQMSEAVILAWFGGIFGIALAGIGLPLLLRAAPENIPNLGDARLNGTALLFTAGVALLTAFVFGLVPAIRSSKPRLVGALRQAGGIGAVGGGRRRWGRDGLVLVQTALALVLLVGSGLLMRSFWTLTHVDPGYDTQDVFTFQVAPNRDGLNDGPTFARFHEDFMTRVAGLPGVEAVGLTNWLPLDEGAASNRFFTEAARQSAERPPPLRMTFIGGDYFETMGIALRQGRVFDSSDHQVGAGTVIVGEAAAETLWPGDDPIGKRVLHDDESTTWLTVVGVVEDIYVSDFRQDAPDPMVYMPMVGPEASSWAVGSPAYVVKTPRADAIAPEIRALMREHVPESPMYRVFTMAGLADRSMAQLSFTMLMLGIASALALVLGAVGLYGVLSYVVSTRNREIAVRMALGAENREVRRMVVRQGAQITGAGVVTGLLAAIFLTRVLESLLFGVGSLDLPTFAAMAGLMLAVALLASYVPARRASSVDPMESLRAE